MLIVDTNTRVCVALLLCQMLQNTVSVPRGNVPGVNGYNRCHILSQKRSGAIDIIDGHDVFEGVNQSHY